MRHASPWIRAVAGSLVLLVALTFSAPLAAAGEASASAPPKPLSAAMATTLAKLDPAAAIAPTQGAAPTSGGKSSWKSPKGAIAIVLMLGITAYTIKSRVDDHIHSVIR